ncbi:MAG TPA: AAA family ATPase [Polyangiaceae bacterium]|nr:AAA family ATPase [Polyangiaceae bacterium]
MGARKFEDRKATRGRTPLLIGIVGPSGSGKTYSALRLATGMQRVVGGEIFLTDTESGRAEQYADDFTFRHTPFEAPYSPADYLSIFEYCQHRKASIVICDSMSHEHEGIGGVLEMHEAEVRRMAGDDYKKAEKIKLLAWSKPKQERQRLKNAILTRMGNMHFIFCFRAKEKIKLEKGEKEPIPLGWMPISGDDYIYEMTLNMLLYPGSDGVPTWKTDMPGERAIMKLPAQFRNLFARSAPLSEDIGQALASWASGARSGAFEAMASRIANAPTPAALEQLVPELKGLKVSPAELKLLREAYGERKKALEGYQLGEDEQEPEPPIDDDEPPLQEAAL